MTSVTPQFDGEEDDQQQHIQQNDSEEPPVSEEEQEQSIRTRKRIMRRKRRSRDSKQKQLHACRFDSWFDVFRAVTFKSVVIPLSPEFVAYLLSDGVYVHSSAFPTPAKKTGEYDDDDDDDAINWDEDDDDEGDPPPSFPELELSIEAAIETLGGYVFPKMTWSSPRDACWMNTEGNLKCRNVAEIFLLLQSSDFVSHDLCHAEERFRSEDDNASEATTDENESGDSEGHVLALRKFYVLKESMEFRCFVRGTHLVGISQRTTSCFFPFLRDRSEDIISLISGFHLSQIKSKFPLYDYTYDVYITPKERVWLVDFNPWHSITESLLFNWNEWEKDDEVTENGDDDDDADDNGDNDDDDDDDDDDDVVVLRLVQHEGYVRPDIAMTSRLPRDLVDVSDGSAIDQFIKSAKEKDSN
eukprot:TRINITY_DN2117_c0_g1_i1.p1 TRINITY_DN2117_c0_g1~~TRINITY_DN2117_c0_g1_i1.p1  ORF type:complete len:414 (+),score=112.50 TRINITY_DN2117_c0_g1_i1:129-1370(+)